MVLILQKLVGQSSRRKSENDHRLEGHHKTGLTKFQARTRCKINLTFQSPKPPNLRVVKMVLNTQCYQHLWLTMWFHKKIQKKRSKRTKIADFTIKIWLPRSGMTKNCQKNGSLKRNLLNFLYGMVWYGMAWNGIVWYVWYILDASWWILLSRWFRICVTKGGRAGLEPCPCFPNFLARTTFVLVRD